MFGFRGAVRVVTLKYKKKTKNTCFLFACVLFILFLPFFCPLLCRDSKGEGIKLDTYIFRQLYLKNVVEEEYNIHSYVLTSV